MSNYTREALAEAVNALVADADAATMHKQMLGIIELRDRQIPAQLTGRPAILNPLVELYAKDQDAFDRVMELVNRKRHENGFPPLEVMYDDPDDATDRKAYMREFMAKKREKQALLVKLWNELRSDNDQLRGVRRMEFEREHAARWQDEKKRREDATRARLGRRLTEGERKAIAAKLWEDVQDELDTLAEFVREQVRKPLHMRAPGGFEFKVGTLKKGK